VHEEKGSSSCSCKVIRCRNNTFGNLCRLCISSSWRMWTFICLMSFASIVKTIYEKLLKTNLSMSCLVLFLCQFWSHNTSQRSFPNILPLTPIGSNKWSLLAMIPIGSNMWSKQLPAIVNLCLPSKKKRLNNGFGYKCFGIGGMILFFAPFDLCFFLQKL
jgi:hypothetical protein